MNKSIIGLRSFLPHRVDLGYWTLTFLTFLISAKLGQFLYSDLGTAPALFWPPTGVALAAVFLWGNRMISSIALAAFVVSASSGAPVQLVLASTFGNALQAFAGAYLFRLFEFRPYLSRLRDTLLLFGVGLVMSAVVPTTIYIIRQTFGPLVDNPGDLWRTLWSGGVLSVFILTPFITGYMQDRRIRPERMVEHTIAIVAAVVVAYIQFWTSTGMLLGIPLVYFMLPPFFWIALRFSPRSTALALFLVSVVAISGALTHAPESLALGQWLFQTQLLLEIFAVIFLILSSAVEDRRTATEELQAHVSRLENTVTKISEQDSAKSDFLAILSHELRNPLAPVLSTLELLRLRRDPHEEEAIILAGAEQRLQMMGRLLDDLLDMSRVSEKRLKLQKEYLSLSDIAKRSVESARPLVEKFKHELVVSLPSQDAYLFADPIRIEQVLVNVLNNAAKYTSEGGKIEFRAESIGSKAIVTIRDNGTGIEHEMLETIFEPFIQVSNTKYGTSGVGVGLALAKELVELHEGKISALSAGLGRGSTFVIEFPTVEAPVAVTPAVPASAVRERSTRSLEILIVDDNQAGAEALGRLLTFRGHVTTLAFSGSEGVEKGGTDTYDAILLDIGLPDIEGYEVARRLRSIDVKSFIVALTGYGQDEDRKKALDSGCDGHLTKPVGLQDIETALRARFGI